jgi:small-conductance mechanosensitive channel
MVIVDRAGEALGGFLPRLGGALVLLIVGLLVARILARLLRRLLERLGVDDLAERWGVAPVLERAGLGRSLSKLLATIVRLGVTIVVCFAALSLLGLQFLSQSLNEALLFLPNVIAAAALVLAGVVLGALAREKVDRLAWQMDLPVPLGAIAQVAVVAVFAVTAAAQIAVSTAILMVLIGVLLTAATATFALAFGLGGREVARELSAGRYVRTSYEPGQRIGVDGVSGEIVSIEPAVTVIRTGAGDRVHVPNATLLSSIVTVYDEPTSRNAS